jgi:hypothetical protein
MFEGLPVLDGSIPTFESVYLRSETQRLIVSTIANI